MAYNRWIWVEDTATGHRYDVDHRRVAHLVAASAVQVVHGYPPNEGPNVHPRRPKHTAVLADLIPPVSQPIPLPVVTHKPGNPRRSRPVSKENDQ